MYRKGSDELAAVRAELVSYGTRLLDDGLAVGSAGNLSVRMGDIVAITPIRDSLRGPAARRHLPRHAGIEGLGQALDFLGRAQPAAADRIAAAAAGALIHEGADP